MSNTTSLIEQFNLAVDSGTIKMTVDHDCGHAYNSWSGPLWDLLSGLAQEVGGEDLDEWEEATNERLSKDDPGLICVPEFINTLITQAGGKLEDRVTACDDECSGMNAEHKGKTVEEACDYLQDFMDQLTHMDPDNKEHHNSWFRFDLMEAYIKKNKK